MVTYHLTEADISAGNEVWRRHQIRPLGLVIFFVLTWIGISAFASIADLPVIWVAILGAASAAGSVIGLLVAGRFNSKRQALRYFRQASTSGQEISVDWDETHIHFRQAESYQKLAWQDVKAWRETDDLVVLIRIGPQFTPVPKRALGVAELENLRGCMAKASIPLSRRLPI